MAFKDQNGKITIDEVAARNDILRIESAINSLNNSKQAINNLIQQAANGQGQVTTAIIDKAAEMRNQIDEMVRRLNETSSFISRTVSHYQQLDQQIKREIEAAAAVASGAGGTINGSGNGQFGGGGGGGRF